MGEALHLDLHPRPAAAEAEAGDAAAPAPAAGEAAGQEAAAGGAAMEVRMPLSLATSDMTVTGAHLPRPACQSCLEAPCALGLLDLIGVLPALLQSLTIEHSSGLSKCSMTGRTRASSLSGATLWFCCV